MLFNDVPLGGALHTRGYYNKKLVLWDKLELRANPQVFSIFQLNGGIFERTSETRILGYSTKGECLRYFMGNVQSL